VHKLYSSGPRSELKEYVRAFAQREVNSLGVQIVQAVPACLEQVIEFEFGDRPTLEFGDGRMAQAYQVSAVGLSAYCPANIVLSGNVTAFGIFFQPVAFWRLFHVPTSELTNNFCNCSDLLGVEIQQLWYEMAQNASFESRVKLAEKFLLNRVANAAKNNEISSAALHMVQHSGMIRVDRVASRSSLGVRQFERRFIAEIGISPKLFARVARFQSVLDAKILRQNYSWTNLAYEYGFHDQMHMIKDFRSLSGFSPEQLIERFGDMRPVALAASRECDFKHIDYSEINSAINFRTGCGVICPR
jgi:methylphosphotriester-DNA--protein-cysteine methyltransferase